MGVRGRKGKEERRERSGKGSREAKGGGVGGTEVGTRTDGSKEGAWGLEGEVIQYLNSRTFNTCVGLFTRL